MGRIRVADIHRIEETIEPAWWHLGIVGMTSSLAQHLSGAAIRLGELIGPDHVIELDLFPRSNAIANELKS